MTPITGRKKEVRNLLGKLVCVLFLEKGIFEISIKGYTTRIKFPPGTPFTIEQDKP